MSWFKPNLDDTITVDSNDKRQHVQTCQPSRIAQIHSQPHTHPHNISHHLHTRAICACSGAIIWTLPTSIYSHSSLISQLPCNTCCQVCQGSQLWKSSLAAECLLTQFYSHGRCFQFRMPQLLSPWNISEHFISEAAEFWAMLLLWTTPISHWNSLEGYNGCTIAKSANIIFTLY